MKKIVYCFAIAYCASCTVSKRMPSHAPSTFEDSLRQLYAYVDSFHASHALYDAKTGYDLAEKYLDSPHVGGDSLIDRLVVRSEYDSVGKKYLIRNDYRITANGHQLSQQIMFYVRKLKDDIACYLSSSYSFYTSSDTSSPMMVRVSEVKQDDVRQVMKRVFSHK